MFPRTMAPLAYQVRSPGWQVALHVPEVVPGVGVHVVMSAPPMVADATAGEIELSASVVKWFTASAAVSWHSLHVAAPAPKRLTWNVCSPEA